MKTSTEDVLRLCNMVGADRCQFTGNPLLTMPELSALIDLAKDEVLEAVVVHACENCWPITVDQIRALKSKKE